MGIKKPVGGVKFEPKAALTFSNINGVYLKLLMTEKTKL